MKEAEWERKELKNPKEGTAPRFLYLDAVRGQVAGV